MMYILLTTWTLVIALYFLFEPALAALVGSPITNAAWNAAAYTYPFRGTCGEVNGSSIYSFNGNRRECTVECPSPSANRQYQEKQKQIVSDFIFEGSRMFLADGCNFPEFSANEYKYVDAPSSPCYLYENERTVYKRETHSLWIKPNLKGKAGTIVTPSQSTQSTFGITSDHHLIQFKFFHDGRQLSVHVYDNTHIPDNIWTHLAFQVDHQVQSTGEVSVFVNGLFAPPVLPDPLTEIQPSRRKRQSGMGSQAERFSVGITNNQFTRGDAFQPEPLIVEQCLAIGYSPSVIVACVDQNDYSENGEYPDFPTGETPQLDCNISYLDSQANLQELVFTDATDQGIYKNCPYNRDVVTLFACASYLPLRSLRFGLHLVPCRSLCEEVFSNCPGSEMPGVNANCTAYPVNDCVNASFIQGRYDGLFKGEMRDYQIFDEILTNREIELLFDEEADLQKVHGLSDCLCPPEHPALSEIYGDSRCVKNYDIDKKEEEMRNFSRPRLYSPNLWYHLPEYAVDNDSTTAWVSSPGLEEVALDIIFNDPVQVLGVIITMAPALPSEGLDGDSPLTVYLMSAGVTKPVAVLAESCDVYNISHPYSATCVEIQIGHTGNHTYHINLLEGKERWFNDSYMDIVLLTFLRAEGLRLQFSGFNNTGLEGPTEQVKFHLVSEVEVTSRQFAGSVLCDCYVDATDIEGSCDDNTGQCPCLPNIGNEAYAGLKCEPYVRSLIPNYGPESGGTPVQILGGYFGENEVAVQGILGKLVVALHVEETSQTRILAVTPPINASINSELLAEPMEIIITLSNGHVIESGMTFQYMEDPVITDIFPLESFIKGGIPQTVVGQDLDSVYEPYMEVIMVLQNVEYKGIPQFTLCEVVNAEKMICPTPSFESVPTLQRKKRDVVESPVSHDSLYRERTRRQADSGRTLTGTLNVDGYRQFYISFYLDGVPTYRNVTEALGEDKGIIYVFSDPVIEAFDNDVMIFRPYKGEDKLEITGQKMTYGCQRKDYVVSIGEGLCDNGELLTNQLTCFPPGEPPELGLFAKDGAHRVLCNVGNITVHMGYMEYRTSLLDEPWFVAVIVVVCLVLGIVLICLAIYFFMWKYYGESPYRRLQNHRKQQKTNMYVMGPDGEPDTHLLQPRQKDLMTELKHSEPVLHEKVMKCKIDPERMNLGTRIGKGNFGMVHEAIYSSPEGQIMVAVKTLKGGSDSLKDMTDFLEEATIMQDFNHVNVLTLHGVVIDKNTPYVLLPLMDKGDLKNYVSNPQNHFSVGELLGYSCQIANGMAYLASLKFVHRDLAARNCMINSDQLVKIADFGLARDIYEKDYYMVQDRQKPLPVKWMAVECLDTFKFSTKSDVWAYAVTVWELLMRGVKPYSDVDNVDMKRYLLMGRRLTKPAYCPDKVYELLFECWAPEPDDRPEFKVIMTRLESFLATASDFESNPLYEGKEGEQHEERPTDYLDLMGMAPGVAPGVATERDDTYQGYLQLVTGVPSEMPSSALLNNNPDVPVYGGASGSGIDSKQPSDRYSKDPTVLGLDKPRDRLQSSESYMDPVSAQYTNLKNRRDAPTEYADLKSTKAESPTSPGYLQPVSFTKRDGREGVTIGDKEGDRYTEPPTLSV